MRSKKHNIHGKWYNHGSGTGRAHNFVSLGFVSLGDVVKDHYGCPVQGTINVIGGKWKVLAIWHLGFAPKRFAQLRELLPGISEKVLTAQLRQLEADGIVGRRIKRSSPPQVTYSLTRAGRELIEPMSVLCKWGTQHLGIPPNLPRYPRT